MTPLGQPNINAPFSNSDGIVQTVWNQWMVQVYNRLGGVTGVAQIPAFTNTTLPPAGLRPQELGGGDNTNGQIYISNTSKPAWSDGTVWRYADGTPV